MKPNNNRRSPLPISLIEKYEEMLKSGDVTICDPEVFEALIEYYETENKPAKLSEVLRIAIERFPYRANFHISQASHLLSIGAFKQSRAALDKAEVLAPEDWEVKFCSAEIHVVEGNRETAKALLNNIIEHNPEADLGMVYLLLGIIHQEEKHFEEMYEALKLSLKKDPKNDHTLHLFWLAVEVTRKHEESIVMHNWILDKEPYCALAWSNLGHAHSCLNHWEKAAEAFEYAYIIDKDFEFAYRDCATAFINFENYEKALRTLEEGKHCLVDDEEILTQKGICNLELGNFEAARIHLLDALSLSTASADLHFHLGRLHMQNQEWSKSLLYFKRAAQIDEENEEYPLCIAKIYQKLDDQPTALMYYRKACQINPDNLEIQFEYIEYLADEFGSPQALDYLATVKEKFPEDKINYFIIGLLMKVESKASVMSRLTQSLRENFNGHTILLEHFPKLKQDPEVCSLIESMRPVE